MAVELRKTTILCLPGYPIPGQLMLPAPKVSLAKKPPAPRKPKPVAVPPKKFSGKIKLYWQEVSIKPDIIIEVHDPETYAALEILHGIYELEGFEKWQNHPQFDDFYQTVSDKVEVYVNRLKRLKRLHADKWDWDWI